jgi:hypothetical protein
MALAGPYWLLYQFHLPGGRWGLLILHPLQSLFRVPLRMVLHLPKLAGLLPGIGFLERTGGRLSALDVLAGGVG